jgi:signal transduction histidine kinase/DNA-binding response OmpR family regulator/CHASE3 domain sensor protein
LRKSSNHQFVDTVKGKVILSFAFILCVLLVTLFVNRVAFRQITDAIEDLSRPNPKLATLNQLHRSASGLMDLQRIELIEGKDAPSDLLLNETQEVRQQVHQLKNMFRDTPEQLEKIESIDSMVYLRDRLFIEYLRLKFNTAEKGAFNRQLNALSRQLENENLQIDSNVVTSQQTTKTTTILKPVEQPVAQETPKRKKLFGRSRKEEPVIKTEQEVIVEQEFKVTTDTIAVAKRDSTLSNIEDKLQQIESGRNQQRNTLQARELELLKTNSLLINSLLDILTQLENEEMAQVQRQKITSVALANKTVDLTRVLTILFILVAVILAILILSDVTRRNKYRRQLEVAKTDAEYHSAAKQRFLANMSHEIRTPLQSIIGYTEQLQKQQNVPQEHIQAIANSSEYLLQIVNEVLDYSRIISGKFSFDQQVFDMREVLDEVFINLYTQAEKKGIDFKVETSNLEAPKRMLGDPFRLKQILYNLLGNALKFTAEGSVKLTATCLDDAWGHQLVFRIEDTGIGIRAIDMPHIFKQFEQAGNSRETNQNGTGLGLSIVKELVEGQQGSISIESESAKGTQATVKLRYAIAHAADPEETAVIPTQQLDFEGKVWMVDDDEMILRLCSIILDKHGVPHQCFTTAEKLLAETWDTDVKLIFADVRLPGMNGFELCRALRKRNGDDIQIIALTAQILPEEKQFMLGNGYDGLLLKPFTEMDLIDALQHGTAGVQKSASFDFSSLEQMVGNEEQFKAILHQFHSETRQDIDALAEGIAQHDVEQTTLLLHRMAGRVGQMGEKNLAARLRHLEMALQQEDHLEDWTEELEDEIQSLNALLIEIAAR